MDSVTEQSKRPYRRHQVRGKVMGCQVRLGRILLTPDLPGDSREYLKTALEYVAKAQVLLDKEGVELKKAKGNG